MCGRFYIPDQAIDAAVAHLPPDLRAQALEAIAEWVRDQNRPKYNVRPTNQYPVITATGVAPMRWGFVTDKSNSVFNAKRESMHYAIWRESLALRRGLVLAGGFYEWTGPKNDRQPHAITMGRRAPMILAALWQDDPEAGQCFSIITTPATQWMAPLHSRMPLILDAADAPAWLDLTRKPPQVKALMQPYAGELAEFACASPAHDRKPAASRSNFFA